MNKQKQSFASAGIRCSAMEHIEGSLGAGSAGIVVGFFRSLDNFLFSFFYGLGEWFLLVTAFTTNNYLGINHFIGGFDAFADNIQFLKKGFIGQ
jgi:hypothetical protein